MHIFNDEIIENIATIIDNSTTTPSPDPTTPISVGYISVLISIIFFGSNFVPAAKYPIRDGLSFQFFLCCGIWITGAIINLIVGNPPFFPLVLIGGVLWTTGNILSVYVITINGLGLSMLLWCTSNLFMGWASGHFGWFGLIAEKVEKPAFNYIGVALGVLSGLIFLFIRTGKNEKNIEERQPILHSTDASTINRFIEEDSITNNSSSSPKINIRMRIIGCILAIISGIFFGLVFTPSTYIQDHRKDKYPTASKNGLHYIFSMYTGILLSSSTYYIIYMIVKRNRPYVCIQSILPAFISGIMWAIAQAGFLVANSVLSQAISFPLVSTGPSTLAVLWSILYFKDIVGSRNYYIFGGGTALRIIAAVFIILSKPVSN
ncbi:unnamed protein product [Rotaria sp. Silwood1]|nr:unnamed protein product [Rotaria sp. Silwood1]CAF0935100.1 unnamed protein product [Rotaria sp. Silwood1]CAF1024342.1 unnamed protein product [Rotaria sp. Silwood1]CAF3402761.1 unnamed protein product [Rotaria sp. Silwood1]CAF3429109.1 unnamed protein product [Rotaria sp. Silwood1]